MHQKTNYYASNQCYQCTTYNQKNLLIWTLADFSLLMNIIQTFSLIKCDNFFIGLNIIIFFYLFKLKGKVKRDCPNDSSRNECPNTEPHKQWNCRNSSRNQYYGVDSSIAVHFLNFFFLDYLFHNFNISFH